MEDYIAFLFQLTCGENFYDSLSGAKLDNAQVEKGKQVERENLWRWPVFRRITRQEAKAKGYKIIRSRWLLGQRTDCVKARFVACELNLADRVDCWAGTPPTIVHRLLLALSQLLGWSVSVGDVRAAFLNAPLPETEYVCVEPPAGEESDPNVVYLVIRALYGLRKSPSWFQEWFASALISDHWHRCKTDPCLFQDGLTMPMTYCSPQSQIKLNRFGNGYKH